MALRDSWHRALVYFGLAEDAPHDDLDRELVRESAAPPADDGYAAERPNVRRLAARRRRDEFDDIFADDDDGGGRRQTAVLRSVPGGRGGNGGGVRVHLVLPKSFNDAQQVADKFKDSVPVILNLRASTTISRSG